MKVTYENKPAMTFIGFSASIRPEEGYQKCPEFWDKEYSQKYCGNGTVWPKIWRQEKVSEIIEDRSTDTPRKYEERKTKR